MDPKCRVFKDTVDDEVLLSRVTYYSLLHRFWQPLPECDIGEVIPGFIFVMLRSGKNVYYGQMPRSKEYLCGYYNPIQFTQLKDQIIKPSEFPDSLAIYCAHSTTTIPTNTWTTYNVNGVISVQLISGQNVVDHQLGIRDFGSMVKLPNGQDWLLTSEPAVRIFNGQEFSDNIAKDRMMSVLETFQPAVAVMYDPFNGVSIFGLDE